MKNYQSYLKAISAPEVCLRAATEKEVRKYHDSGPPGFPTPPALVPFWDSIGTGDGQIGYWTHWFVGRSPSFVDYVFDGEPTCIEIARTAQQFIDKHVAELMVGLGEDNPAEISRFCENIGGSHSTDLESFVDQYGDNDREMWRLSAFKIDCPLYGIKNLADYDGSFPTGYATGTEWWLTSCKSEITAIQQTPAVRTLLTNGNSIQQWQWPEQISQPPWVQNDADQKTLFEQYLDQGQMDKAWLTLNSYGWMVDDAHTAIKKLAEVAQVAEFNLLVEAWIELTWQHREFDFCF